METTTIIAWFFVATIAVIGLRCLLVTCFFPHQFTKLEIVARRFASKLWWDAYRSDDIELREKLFGLSEEIDAYAKTIRENRIVLQDFEFCTKTIETLKNGDVNDFKTFSNDKKNTVLGKLFLVYLVLFALAMRYPLSFGVFLINISIVVFLVGWWKEIKIYFSDAFVGVGDAALQSMPT